MSFDAKKWPVVVELTPAESAFALSLATQRYCSKAGIVDRWVSQKHTGFGVHFAGCVGEMCFRKVYGGKLNQTISVRGDRHVPDVVLKDGRGVEVKASLFSGDDVELKIEGKGELDGAEWFCLVQVILPDVGRVFPLIGKEMLLPILRERDYGKGIRFAARGSDIIEARVKSEPKQEEPAVP